MKEIPQRPGRRRLAALALALCTAITCLLPGGVLAAGMEDRQIEKYAVQTGREEGRVIELDNHGKPLRWEDAKKAIAHITGDDDVTLVRNKKDLSVATAVRTGDIIRFGDASTAAGVIKYDVVGSGQVSITQLVACAKHLNECEPLSSLPLLAGDVDGCGKITIVDLVLMARRLGDKDATGPLDNLPDSAVAEQPSGTLEPVPSQSAQPDPQPPAPSATTPDASHGYPSSYYPQHGPGVWPPYPVPSHSGSGSSQNTLRPDGQNPNPSASPSSTYFPGGYVPGSEEPSASRQPAPVASPSASSTPSVPPSASEHPTESPAPTASVTAAPSASPDKEEESSNSPSPSPSTDPEPANPPESWYDESKGLASMVYAELNKGRFQNSLGELIPDEELTRIAQDNVDEMKSSEDAGTSSPSQDGSPAQVWAQTEVSGDYSLLLPDELAASLADSILKDPVWEETGACETLETGLSVSKPVGGALHVNLIARDASEEKLPAFDKKTLQNQLIIDFRKLREEGEANILFGDTALKRMADARMQDPEEDLSLEEAFESTGLRNAEYDLEAIRSYRFCADLRDYVLNGSSPMTVSYKDMSAGCLKGFEETPEWSDALDASYNAYGVGISEPQDGNVFVELLIYPEKLWRPADTPDPLEQDLLERMEGVRKEADPQNAKLTVNQALADLAKEGLNMASEDFTPQDQPNWPQEFTDKKSAFTFFADAAVTHVAVGPPDDEAYSAKALAKALLISVETSKNWEEILSGEVQIGIAISDTIEQDEYGNAFLRMVAVAYTGASDVQVLP